jgi:hypothetical protein
MISIFETLRSVLVNYSQNLKRQNLMNQNSDDEIFKTKKLMKMICDDLSTNAQSVDLNLIHQTKKNNEIRTKTFRPEKCEEKLIQSFFLFLVLMMKFDVI